MSNLLAIREKIKSFYAAFEIYITPALKFITAFVTLLLINKNLGFMGKIGSTAIVLIVALMCSFLPLNFIILFATVFIMAHMYKLSLEIAVFTLCLFLLLYLLYFRFSPKDTTNTGMLLTEDTVCGSAFHGADRYACIHDFCRMRRDSVLSDSFRTCERFGDYADGSGWIGCAVSIYCGRYAG